MPNLYWYCRIAMLGRKDSSVWFARTKPTADPPSNSMERFRTCNGRICVQVKISRSTVYQKETLQMPISEGNFINAYIRSLIKLYNNNSV